MLFLEKSSEILCCSQSIHCFSTKSTVWRFDDGWLSRVHLRVVLSFSSSVIHGMKCSGGYTGSLRATPTKRAPVRAHFLFGDVLMGRGGARLVSLSWQKYHNQLHNYTINCVIDCGIFASWLRFCGVLGSGCLRCVLVRDALACTKHALCSLSGARYSEPTNRVIVVSMKGKTHEWIAIAVAVVIVGAFFFVLDGSLWTERSEGNNGVQNAAATGEALREKLQSGSSELVVEDVVEGAGAEAAPGDSLSVHYVGVLTDGTQFDSSLDRGIPFEFTLGVGSVISGWDTGLVGMKVGGRRVLIIPPEMAYGEQGTPGIPPNSTLIFEVLLLEIK